MSALFLFPTIYAKIIKKSVLTLPLGHPLRYVYGRPRDIQGGFTNE